jgi:hypothetical protein
MQLKQVGFLGFQLRMLIHLICFLTFFLIYFKWFRIVQLMFLRLVLFLGQKREKENQDNMVVLQTIGIVDGTV